MKKILLADDHHMVMDGLFSILQKQPDLEVVGRCVDGLQVIEFLEQGQVDLLCMDIEMPRLDGVDTSRKVKEKFPDVKILILSMFKRSEFIYQLAEMGIDGYLNKDAPSKELLKAIGQVLAGRTYFDQHFTQALVEARQLDRSGVRPTRREKEVLVLLAQGLKTEDIAEKLFISTHTVKSHRKSLLTKFDVANTPSLVQKAREAGIIH